MNSSTTSDETEKIWDHPWSTDEMRQYRSDWNLAGDVGLLRHLQQFSENLTASVKNTQTTLDLLNSQLNETTVLIDNVTNASLALANTQFIESRVYEDDTDNEVQQNNAKKADKKNSSNTEIMTKTDMIATVSENIRRGLAVMDEKYERLEVISSDSEDENEISQPSFILRPKDPYQNRPLPYVIGTDKWKSSNKLGLQSSSSESDVIDDDNDDDETESDKDMDELSQHIFLENSRRISILRRSSLSSSGSSDFNEKSITNKQYSETSSHTDNKLYTRSQDTLNSTSEITTPTAGPRGGENLTRDTPSFAEELAKRLGNVMPIDKTKVVEKHDANQSSINHQSKNDFFANYGHQNDDNDDYNDDNRHIFNEKSNDLFGGAGGLFDDDGEASNSLWRDKPIRRPQKNIIPPSIDVPPPMHSTEIKRNSAIDDLFGDNDSDDSDDIFASKNSNKSTIKSVDTVDVTKKNPTFSNIIDNKLLTTSQQFSNKIASSTPENNNNVPNLFEDDENDGNLFGSPQKSNSNKQSPESSQNPQRGRPPGILVSQSDLLSSSLGSRLFKRQESSDSSENDDENILSNASQHEDKNTTRPSENNSNISSIRDASNRIHVETSDSSGVSTHPRSMNSTLSMGGANQWNPQMESTRLPSDELYRERVTSDSLLNPKTRQQVSNNSAAIVSNDNPSLSSNPIRESHDIHEENLFDNNDDDDDDDVFSPPPLPTNKSKPVSKVTSLFDDSDSGDDLFSNTSSGSRSQKSADILTNLTQQQLVEKFKSGQKRGGLFDEGVDIFANTNSSSAVDISTSTLTSKDRNQFTKQQSQLSNDSKKRTIENSDNVSNKLLTSLTESKSVKSTSIFDDSEPEDEDLFSSIIHSKPMVNKLNDENNFSATTSVNSADPDGLLTVPKKDFTVEPAEVVVVGDKESKVSVEKYNRDNNQPFVTSKISENKLFDDSDDGDDDDNDDDNLFSQKRTVLPQIKTQKIQIDKSVDQKVDSVFEPVESQKISMESTDKSNEFDEIHSKEKDENKSPPKMDNLISKVSENPDNSLPGIPTKKEPPKNLKIRLPVVGAVEDPNIPPRRAVSGKIKDLMGKMGDLKILSPTDTPLPWRKSENPTSEEDNDNDTPDRDSEDGSSISVPSTKSLPTLPNEQIIKKESSKSPSIETESAVSFDIPAQADTLTVTASKSRVRIPVKRRPQSRHARQSALRISGIDFDTVDTVADSSPDVIDTNETLRADSKIERPIISNDGSDGDGDGSLIRPVKPALNFISDDKSEFSLGKESSVSITKNTLLSPSTDEEDLFDVPPDLPEDPQKEDSLFGRAPILSPIPRPPQDSLQSPVVGRSKNDQDEVNSKNIIGKDSKTTEKAIESKTNHDDNEEKLIDPLRDESRDPLKNPSQLFAFVTKTPSPEKGQNSLSKEDDSLFSQTIKKINYDTESAKKPSFDIFVNDSSSDLFSGPFTKVTPKKPMKGTKGNLFSDLDSDDDDATDDLFVSASSKRSNQSKSEHSDIDTNEVSCASGNSPKQIDPFDDDDDEDLFFDASEKPSLETGKDDQTFSFSTKVKKTKLEDIFGDQSGGEDDIFAIKKPIGRGTTAGGLFFSDDGEDPNDIFTKKQSSSSAVNIESVENRLPIKKAITRDLRKTAEKIVEDPLSMLHDD